MTVSPPLLIEALGERFLRYILALESSSLDEWMTSGGTTGLTPPQSQALENLDLILSAFPPAVLENEYQRHFQVSDVLGRYVPEQECTVAVAIRAIASGAEPVQGALSGDAVLDSLARMAVDLYPLLLLPRPEQYFSLIPGASHFSHPTRTTFEDAVLADPDLSGLFHHYTEAGGYVGSIFASTGHGGSIQLWTLSSQTLSNAWVLASASSSDNPPSVEEFIETTGVTLSRLRSAVRGDACPIPVRIGFAGALLDANQEIQLPWGRLRPRSAQDDAVIPDHLRGQLNAHAEDGETVTIDYCGDITLETEVDLTLMITEWDPTSFDWPASLPNSHATINALTENSQVALMLSDLEQLPLIVPTWSHYFDPTSNSGFYSLSRNQSQNTQLRPQRIAAEQATEWARIGGQLNEVPFGRIAISRRRVLQAAAERRDPNDVLVDAVIAWESLVGADSETVFRVSGAMAWLLEPDNTEARTALQREIKKIYGIRSSVVHGSGELSEENARTVPDRALLLAAASMSRLIMERKDLLQFKNVADRSNRLILGI